MAGAQPLEEWVALVVSANLCKRPHCALERRRDHPAGAAPREHHSARTARSAQGRAVFGAAQRTLAARAPFWYPVQVRGAALAG
jgi:hypothetical protein